MKKYHSTLVALFVAAGMAMTSAQATPLDLSLADSPDIVAAFIGVDYDASLDSFSAHGFALNMFDGGSQAISGGLFSLNASIDDAGDLFAGAMTISGTIADLGFTSGTLLTGTLTAVGSDTSGGLLEFLFTVTGGDAAALFGDAGGIIMGDTGFGGWGSDFGSFSASADIGPLPASEPGILLLQALGLCLLFLTRSRSAI